MSTPPFVELPDGVFRTSVLTNRGEFAALRADPPADASAAPTTLLVPGYSGSKEDFIAMLAPIAAGGRTVIAVDQRGQYETPGPATHEAYTTDALGADVRAMVAALSGSGPLHLLGHSFGGLVTRSALLADPTGVCSYTVLGSGPGRIIGVRSKHARLLVEVVAKFGPNVVAPTMQRFERLKAGPKPPDEVVEFVHRRLEVSSPYALVAMARALLTEPDRVDDLAALGVPTLVAYGDGDDAWPPAVQAAMATRLGAGEAIFAGAGHSPNVDVPDDLVKTLLRFWDDAEGPGIGAETALTAASGC
ncbi:MAG: alpha/beta fold hydrolase [Streptosporangiales bacterium]|nr:alpha/beta fold hydrolase [Streptosporangiales bacterium]